MGDGLPRPERDGVAVSWRENQRGELCETLERSCLLPDAMALEFREWLDQALAHFRHQVLEAHAPRSHICYLRMMPRQCL